MRPRVRRSDVAQQVASSWIGRNAQRVRILHSAAAERSPEHRERNQPTPGPTTLCPDLTVIPAAKQFTQPQKGTKNNGFTRASTNQQGPDSLQALSTIAFILCCIARLEIFHRRQVHKTFIATKGEAGTHPETPMVLCPYSSQSPTF
jgi:hypothetical protein